MTIGRIAAGVALGLALSQLGTAIAAPDGQEAANMRLVDDYYRQILTLAAQRVPRERLIAADAQYRTPDYVEHSAPRVAPAAAPASPPRAPVSGGGGGPGPSTTLALMAQGDLVIQVSSRTMPDPAAGGAARKTTIFNMFRIRDGKLAEHWDAFAAASDG